jgi:hypothetical protein
MRAPLAAAMIVNICDPSIYSQIQEQPGALSNVAGIERSRSTQASTP